METDIVTAVTQAMDARWVGNTSITGAGPQEKTARAMVVASLSLTYLYDRAQQNHVEKIVMLLAEIQRLAEDGRLTEEDLRDVAALEQCYADGLSGVFQEMRRVITNAINK